MVFEAHIGKFEKHRSYERSKNLEVTGYEPSIIFNSLQSASLLQYPNETALIKITKDILHAVFSHVVSETIPFL